MASSTSYNITSRSSNTLYLVTFSLLLLTSIIFFTKKTLEPNLNLYFDNLIWSNANNTSSKVNIADHRNDGVQTDGGNDGVDVRGVENGGGEDSGRGVGNDDGGVKVVKSDSLVVSGDGVGTEEVKSGSKLSDEVNGVEAGVESDEVSVEEVKKELLASENIQLVERGVNNDDIDRLGAKMVKNSSEVSVGVGDIEGAGVVSDEVGVEEVEKRTAVMSESGAGGNGSAKDATGGDLAKCDLYSGSWVKDERYPIYKPGLCPFIDEAFDCQGNGRGDSEYLKWRWRPDGCELPRYNATDFLERLRGKRMMLVGDSMNRNQFESLMCLLREGVPNKSRMYEIHGHQISKGRGFYVFKFEDYNCSVEFVRSHFLVKEGIRLNAQGRSNPTLSIDRIDKPAPRWKRADILVFNTGHWWTHGKTARGKNYYKEGDFIYPEFDAMEAFRRSINTWGRWIDQNINPAKQLVFYRGYSSAHFRGGDWDSGGSCNGEKEPILSGAFLDTYPPKMTVVQEVIAKMKVPVVLLNVTKLTNFRKDGHPSVYGKNLTAGRKPSTRRQDCSHWCLPGVPDAWNELIYTSLIIQQTTSLIQK